MVNERFRKLIQQIGLSDLQPAPHHRIVVTFVSPSAVTRIRCELLGPADGEYQRYAFETKIFFPDFPFLFFSFSFRAQLGLEFYVVHQC